MAEARVSPAENLAEREIVISRVFDAPRELVWDAWTDPKQVVKWWGPKGFSITIHEMDVRPGGVWRHTMHGPDGMDYPNHSVFLEVVKPERIVFSHGGGRQGEKEDAQFEATWTFEAQGDKTKLTVRMLFPSAAARDIVVKRYGAIEGGNQTLGRLAEHLQKASEKGEPIGATAGKSARGATVPEFVISRIFDAPRDLVWKAFTERDRMAQWWGPKGSTWVSAKLDLRPEGVFHYCMRAPTGQELWGKFVYREIVAPECIVFVNSFSDEKGNVTRHFMSPTWPLEVLNVMTLTEDRGRTTITLKGHPINASELEQKTFADGYKSMQQGFSCTFDQLANYLATL